MKQVRDTITAELTLASFSQREEERYHHSYDNELLQYEYLRDGDLRGVEESKQIFRSSINGKLSKDPLRDKKYLFVAAITLATRFAIEGGMSANLAYHLSDLYIQRMDLCQDIEDVFSLHTEMFEDFTLRMSDLRRQTTGDTREELTMTRATAECIDYINLHLHSRITVTELGKALGFSPNYLNMLFRRETGLTIQEYIRKIKIEEAKKLLLYSHFTMSEIAEYLAFSSPSHFGRVFRDETGISPKKYQAENFRHHQRWSRREYIDPDHLHQ